MKKIFTLLFCVGAMALASNANTLHERCIEYLLNGNAAATLNATQTNDLDANHDGVINMDDLTTIINMELAEAHAMNAPAPQNKRDELKNQTRKVSKMMPISRTIHQQPKDIKEKIKKEQKD